MSVFSGHPNFDFIGKRWYAIGLSGLLVIGGLAAWVAGGGLPLGIDFSGGTLIVLEFDQPTTEDTVRDALSAVEEKDVRTYGDSGGGILIRLPQSSPEQGLRLEAGAEAVVSALESSGLGGFEEVSRELVGPVIGAELKQRGVSAFGFALVGILVYIGWRFSFSFGVGAIVAVAHDILITLSMLMFFGYELSLNVVAAMLTITGYSVNDSIVVFDRVRENLRTLRRDRFEAVVNTSVNQTLARTIITSGTTGFAALALFLFGGEVLRGFAFTILVGVFSGTYSTIFIAASVAIVITERKAERRRRQAAVPVSSNRPRQGAKAKRADKTARSARSPRAKRPGRKAPAS